MRILPTLALLLALSATAESAPRPGREPATEESRRGLLTAAGQAEKERFDFLLYGGKFSDTTFGEIILEQETDYLESYVWVAGLNYELGKFLGPITIETEGQIAQHTGLQGHWETNVLIIIRHEWLWQNAISFSMALGDGFSLATRVPRLERVENPSSNVLLQYLMGEIDLGLPSVSGWPRLMMRLHHRSGVFGVYCSNTCGSNFVTYGVKYAF